MASAPAAVASAAPPAPAAPVHVRAGTATMAAGLILLGLSGAVYLAVSARAVGPVAFASLSTLWTLVYTFGIGVFMPFEQELGRAFAARAARGAGTGPLVRKVALVSAVLLAVLLAAGLVLSPPLVSGLFSGGWTPPGVFALSMAVMAAGYVMRGIYAGSSRFGWYSAQLGVEGFVRIAVCGALLGLGVHAAAPYLWLLALAPLAALPLTLPGLRGALRPGPPAPWSELSANLGWLLLAGVAAQAVANAALVALQFLSGRDGTAGRLLAAFVIARVPLFLFQGVQAVLLPGLAGALAAGDRRAFRGKLRGVLAATGAVALAGVLGAAVAGPWLVRLAFGDGFALDRGHLVVLAAATGCYMLAQVFQAGLVALERHRDNALCWSAAFGVFLAVCLVPLPALVRVEAALALSCAAAAVLLAARLYRRWAAHAHGTR
ncbi:lipopolysaccharide biosynthesis protein [Actinocorallia populi]|uniref:lipopolysaccharide biosynthesis protein n=1 Tax=Actinocorallia populi TaxID=2079200 RepID=UPI000D08D4F2|nr:hypothetical protein [Actinocorallia populi]